MDPQPLVATPSGGAPSLAVLGDRDPERENTIAVLHKLARSNPRNPVAIREAVLGELRFAPDLAVNAYYSIKYAGSSKPVSGPSIRAAEALARSWGNNVATVSLTGETDDHVEMTGRFVDLETLHMTEKPFRAPKRVKRRGRGGKEDFFVTLRGEQLAQATQSAASKALRNAILAGLPDWLKHGYEQEARRLVSAQENERGTEARDAFLDRMRKWVEKITADHAVPLSDLETALGLPIDSWTAKEAATLRGLVNALEAGIMSVPTDESAARERQESATDAVRKAAERAEGRAKEREADRPGSFEKPEPEGEAETMRQRTTTPAESEVAGATQHIASRTCHGCGQLVDEASLLNVNHVCAGCEVPDAEPGPDDEATIDRLRNAKGLFG